MGDRLEELTKEYDACRLRCEQLSREIEELRQFERNKKIEGITLEKDAKLIDLLNYRILDTDDDWRLKMDTLISIPHSEQGGALNGGDYIEALFQLAIATGVLPQFRGYPITFYDIDKYKNIKELKNYLYTKTIFNHGGKETGISDISFQLTTSGPTQSGYSCGEVPSEQVSADPAYFISVKGFKREKNIGKDYDIPILYQQLEEFPQFTNKHIVVCVRNKSEFLKRLSRSRMEFLKNSIDQVIGYDEVMDAFSLFRTNFFLRFDAMPTRDTILQGVTEIFPEGGDYKPSLSLYFHQELVVKSVVERMKQNLEPKDPYFLCVGVLPRGGKSYIAGGIIDAHRKLLKKDTYNALFLTSAVNETRDQFKEDLIEKFSEFTDFEFVDVVKQGKKGSAKDKNKFVFVSRQLSSLSSDSDVDTSLLGGDFVARLKRIFKEAKFNICFFDEAHIGIKSENVRKQFIETFREFKMPIVLMSATYKNPAIVLSSPKDLLVWDLQDVKDMRKLSTLGLDEFLRENPDVIQRYPDVAETILRNRIRLGQTAEDIAKPYMNFPMPNFISLTFAPSTIKHLRDTGTGYDFLKAFQINPTPDLVDNEKYKEWGTMLVNREDALRIRQFLTPEQSEGDDFLTDKDRKYRAFNQIFQIAQKTNSRPFLGKPFSVLMFLPYGQGLPIGELCRIWGSFFREVPYWKDNFVFMTLSTYAKHKQNPKMTPKLAVERGLCHREDFSQYTLKEAILTVEREALKNGKGLVLLSGDVAKMGISLKCVDVVCLMSNTDEPDDIIQKMYRALTDDPPTKKNGYIIDLNLKRIVRAMFDYDMEKSRRTQAITGRTDTPKERIQRIMELCNWGQDGFIIDNPGRTFDDVMNEVRERVFSSVEARVHLEYGSRDLVDKQFSVIQRDKELLEKVQDVLKFTTGKRSKKAAKEVLLERGADVPEEERVEGEKKEEKPNPKEAPPEVEPLSPEQIKKKIVDIMITFVNALVIKSDQPWKGMTFESLLDKYMADRASATRVCSCEDTQACGSAFSNMYDIVYCELRGYAMRETKSGEVEYDPDTHLQIMDLMENLFAASSTLSPDWSNYITSLIKDISKGTQSGGVRDKTESINSNLIDNNVRRTTKRNHPRDNREEVDTRRAGKKGTRRSIHSAEHRA